jgi:hypothetical protein
MKKNNNTSLTAKIITPTDSAHACAIIDAVEISPQHTPFLASTWQKSWLNSLQHPPQIVTFSYQDTPIGYVFLGKHTPIAGLPFSIALVNQTGQQDQDQVWIEFNNIICANRYRRACIDALCRLLFSKFSCLRITVSMCEDTSDWVAICDANNISMTRHPHAAYRTHLPPTHNFDAFYQTFSSNTRYQLRRAQRETEKRLGAITLTVASYSQQQAFLAELAKLHILKWGKTPEGSGFTNPMFMAHHVALITDSPEHCSIIKLQAGNGILGYAYYLMQDSTVYFYCSGVNETVADNKIKPGYLLHLYAMQYFASQGYQIYDFMAGDFRYKQSLSSERYTMDTLTLHNPRQPAKAIEKLRELVKKLQ